MPTQIHSQATVDSAAQLGENVVVGPHAVVTRWARLGDGVVVHAGAVVGGDPQYLGFDPATPSYVEVGAQSVLRESVTLNRSMYEGKATVVGARCFFMACSHAGHDSEVADDVVLANNALLAGHVAVGPKAFLGGGAMVHQFCQIGEGVMIAGGARVTKDIAPFCMVAERDELVGLNLVGLKRRDWPREVVLELKEVYRAVFGEPGNPKPRAAALLGEVQAEPVRTFLHFFAESKRSLARPPISSKA